MKFAACRCTAWGWQPLDSGACRRFRCAENHGPAAERAHHPVFRSLPIFDSVDVFHNRPQVFTAGDSRQERSKIELTVGIDNEHDLACFTVTPEGITGAIKLHRRLMEMEEMKGSALSAGEVRLSSWRWETFRFSC